MVFTDWLTLVSFFSYFLRWFLVVFGGFWWFVALGLWLGLFCDWVCFYCVCFVCVLLCVLGIFGVVFFVAMFRAVASFIRFRRDFIWDPHREAWIVKHSKTLDGF